MPCHAMPCHRWYASQCTHKRFALKYCLPGPVPVVPANPLVHRSPLAARRSLPTASTTSTAHLCHGRQLAWGSELFVKVAGGGRAPDGRARLERVAQDFPQELAPYPLTERVEEAAIPDPDGELRKLRPLVPAEGPPEDAACDRPADTDTDNATRPLAIGHWPTERAQSTHIHIQHAHTARTKHTHTARHSPQSKMHTPSTQSTRSTQSIPRHTNIHTRRAHRASHNYALATASATALATASVPTMSIHKHARSHARAHMHIGTRKCTQQIPNPPNGPSNKQNKISDYE
jgi:hypothetical protein